MSDIHIPWRMTTGDCWAILERHGLPLQAPNLWDVATVLGGLEAELAARDAEFAAVLAWAQRAHKFLNTYMSGGAASKLLADAPLVVRENKEVTP